MISLFVKFLLAAVTYQIKKHQIIIFLKIILYWEVLKTKMATSDGNLNLTSLTEGLGKTKFTQVYNLLNISVTENKPKRNFFYDCMPTFYKSKYSKYVKNIVEHW